MSETLLRLAALREEKLALGLLSLPLAIYFILPIPIPTALL